MTVQRTSATPVMPGSWPTFDTGSEKPDFNDTRKEKDKGLRAFTGTVRILIPGKEPIEVLVMQGHVQNQQILADLQLEKGVHHINVQFLVPNNSTGPEHLHVKLL